MLLIQAGLRAHWNIGLAPQPSDYLPLCRPPPPPPFVPRQVFEYFASQRDGKVFSMTAGDMMRRWGLGQRPGRQSRAAPALHIAPAAEHRPQQAGAWHISGGAFCAAEHDSTP